MTQGSTGEGGDDALGLAPGALRLVPHRPAWRALYAAEAGRIAEALAGIPHIVAHLGSTAVPDLPAKPILDIGLAVAAPDEDRAALTLTGIGWIDRKRRPGGGGRLLIRTRDGLRTHNLHVWEPADPEWRDQRDFVAALTADPAHRAAYAAAKAALIAGGTPRAAYADAKGPAIRAILAAWRAR